MGVLDDQVLQSISFQAVVAFWSVPAVMCAGLRSDVESMPRGIPLLLGRPRPYSLLACSHAKHVYAFEASGECCVIL